MKLDVVALKQLVPYVNEVFYRTGPELVDLFNRFGSRDVYGKGFPSRKDYTLDKLMQINESKQLELLLNEIVYSRTYLETDIDINSDLVEPMNEIIRYCGYRFEQNEQGEFIVTGEGLIPDETIEIQTSFENIQRDILEQLDQAQFTIWVSVAWFSDRVLFEKLQEKAAQGVNVQVIINNDSINRDAGLDFESYFETYRKDGFGAYQNNIMNDINIFLIILGFVCPIVRTINYSF
jgi:phosphatidylserine/phosphatidylglycerophosphate/cardiolipin synthase-like enzyme